APGPYARLALPDHCPAALIKLDQCINLLFRRFRRFSGETCGGRRLPVTGGDGDESHQLQRNLLSTGGGAWSWFFFLWHIILRYFIRNASRCSPLHSKNARRSTGPFDGSVGREFLCR